MIILRELYVYNYYSHSEGCHEEPGKGVIRSRSHTIIAQLVLLGADLKRHTTRVKTDIMGKRKGE